MIMGEDIHDVAFGATAGEALIRAFLRARGDFRVEVSIGIERRRPDRILVLITLGDVKAVFTPEQLQTLGESIDEALPLASRFGASDQDVGEMRNFAALLLRNAAEAAALSRDRLH